MYSLIAFALSLTNGNPIDTIHEDLKTVPTELRPFTRYLALLNLPEKEREDALMVLSGHINGLSKEAKIVSPVAIKGLARINISDYGWKSQTWEKFAETDPYFHIQVTKVYPWGGGNWPGTTTPYAKGSFNVIDKQSAIAPWLIGNEADKASLAVIINETKSQAFLLRADWWFANTAIQEGKTVGYYGMLELKNQKDFETVIGFDAKIADKREQRRVVIESGIALQPRRIERAKAIDGGLWKTSDSANATEEHDPSLFLRNDLKFDATEQFAPLPNGMPVWWLGNSKGERQDKAPDNVVGGDRKGTGNDTRLHINLSCIRCHLSRKGENCIKDLNEAPIEKVLSKDYEEQKEITRQYFRDLVRLIKQDREGFEASIKESTGMGGLEYGQKYAEFWTRYEETFVDKARACLDLGVTEKAFDDAINRQLKTTGAIPSHLTLLRSGRAITIRQWETLYPIAQTVIRGIQP